MIYYCHICDRRYETEMEAVECAQADNEYRKEIHRYNLPDAGNSGTR